MPPTKSYLLRPPGGALVLVPAPRRLPPCTTAPCLTRPRQRTVHTTPRKLNIVPPSPPPQKPLSESYLADAPPPIPVPPLPQLVAEPDAAILPPPPPPPPLAALPLGMLLRNLAISTATASPLLLPPALALLSRVANPTGALFDLDRNPALRLAVKRVLYSQFCAGEDRAEVARTCDRLRKMGFTGVILCYGKEAVLEKNSKSTAEEGGKAAAEAQALAAIEAWRQGNLETVGLAQSGDYVALKFSGAGRHVVLALADQSPPPKQLADAIDELCALAVSRGVQLLIDAEQVAVQRGIDGWALAYMRKYNTTPGRATVYNTYQAYLKQTPDVVRAHAETARREGFTLGVKLVRGAYLATDPRQAIHDTKADTDKCFDDLAVSLLTREWSSVLPGSGAFPQLSLIVATHNADSVHKARRLVESGQAKTTVAFAQLQGMADEVSFSLIGPGGSEPGSSAIGAGQPPRATLGAYKYFAWGSATDCMKYLLRRAEENRDAVQRTKDSRDAMWGELKRRLRGVVGL